MAEKPITGAVASADERPERPGADLLAEMFSDVAGEYAEIVARRRRSRPASRQDTAADERGAMQQALALLSILGAQEGLDLGDMIGDLVAALKELDGGIVPALLAPSAPPTSTGRPRKLSRAQRQMRLHAALAVDFGIFKLAAAGVGRERTAMAKAEVAQHLTRVSGRRFAAAEVTKWRKSLRETSSDDDARAYWDCLQRAVAHVAEAERQAAAADDEARRGAIRRWLGRHWRAQQNGELWRAEVSASRPVRGG